MKKIHTFSAAVCLLSLAVSQAIADAHHQEHIVITAKAPVTAAEFSGSVTTITAEDIQLSGATNILEAIQMVPGISVNSVSSRATGRNGISIRGMENNHTLILIDGRRVSNTDTNVPFSDFQYNWVPLVAVERIEVVRGAMSNLYGSSALGGVINIITRSAEDEWSTTAEAQFINTLSGEGGDGEQISFSTSGHIGDKVDLSLSLEQQETDPFLKSFPERQTTANKEGKDYLNAILKAGVEVGQDSRLGISWVNSEDDRTQFPNEHSYSIERNQSSIEYNTKIAGFNLAASVYRSTSDNDLIEQTYIHRLEEDVATVDINGELNESHFLTAGLEYSKEEYHKDYNAESENEFRDNFKSWSAFAQDRFEISDRISLTWGARYDDHERFGDAISPKAHLNWDVTDNWQIKTGYSEGFKAPAVKDASDDYYFSYSYPIGFGPMGPTAFLKNEFIGNSDLKEETSKTFEIGANYSSGNLSGGFTIFRSDVKDLINANEISRVTMGPLTTSTSRYENVANADIFGLESEIGYQFTPNLDAEFNLSLIDHEDSSTGKWLTLRSQVEANLSVTHRLSELGLKTRLQVKYNGKQYIDSDNTNETPATTVVDLNVRKSLGQNAYATFGVKNLLNEFAAEDDINDGTSETGRQFLLTLGANF